MSKLSSDILVVEPVDPEQELDRLAKRYRDASGPAIRLLNMLGGQADNLLDQLPQPVRNGLEGATEQALMAAMKAASHSRTALPAPGPTWVNRAVATSLGAAGGFGGLGGALVELPVTTTVLLRTIQDVAAETGFDPKSESVTFDCVRVLAAAGPLSADDSADLGFFSLRLTLTGGAMQRLIAAVVPRLSVALGQKLAAQAVPVLGAVAGATTNYVYAGYYREVAHVHFGLRRLSIDADLPPEQLLDGLKDRLPRF